MFRNPRENARHSADAILKPSTGRPPTPPPSADRMAATHTLSNSFSLTTPSVPANKKTPPASFLTSQSRSGGLRSGGGDAKKQNGSILSFFKKTAAVNSKLPERGLFLTEGGLKKDQEGKEQNRSQTPDAADDWLAELEEKADKRFNEFESPAKRRKVEDSGDRGQDVSLFMTGDDLEVDLPIEQSKPITPPLDKLPPPTPASLPFKEVQSTLSNEPPEKELDTAGELEAKTAPKLVRQATSMAIEDDFEGLGDFDDEYLDGDEFREREWMMEEQRMFELEDNDDEIQECVADASTNGQKATSGPTCPICSASLAQISSNDATVHVNHCLDGNPIPLPGPKAPEVPETSEKKDITSFNRFKKTPRPPRPGQANPFAGPGPSGAGGSAFSKLMSSHAEDAAWANAAAAENASRGKPAYERTCPFYKIMPGYNICVDAFRYGAVEGCKAYFLSHFHSDHYIGLHANWEHGPIYCSRITANLVRRQLKVNPKYVVDLEFEKKVPVPGCNDSTVTMIPANHCPGSSLFLFERPTGNGRKIQRILHCGDFRACSKHITHPLLRPDLINAVSGKIEGQQKIDVCYLDTTYLNPRYAFPSQAEVIDACGDMCVSLKKERADVDDNWEKLKRERAGDGMMKFVRKDSDSGAPAKSPVKKEDAATADDDDKQSVNAMTIHQSPGTRDRGRLLVVVGTYSIGKERICVGIAQKLGSKIFATSGKQRICAALEDPELDALLTTDPLAAQVHMTPLFEIRADTLQEYLNGYKPHFSRVVGFRPSGWNYRPPNSRFVESPLVSTVLNSANWRSAYSMAELVPQRGSTREASCFGVPYSEHSSFRELTMFVCALRIDKIVPTVNIGSAKSREKMKGWCEKWAAEKKKNGLWKPGEADAKW